MFVFTKNGAVNLEYVDQVTYEVDDDGHMQIFLHSISGEWFCMSMAEKARLEQCMEQYNVSMRNKQAGPTRQLHNYFGAEKTA